MDKCEECGATRLPWLGVAHKCVKLNTIVQFGSGGSLHVTEDVREWLLAA